MKSIFTLAATALLASSIAGQAQARTEWRYPYKSAPYAVQVPDDIVTAKPKAASKTVQLKKANKAEFAGRSNPTRKLAL